MYCSKCGKQIADGSRFCPECGTQFGVPSQPPPQQQSMAAGTRDQTRATDLVYPKNPPLSPHLSWLTLVCTGLPHWIYGQVAKGFIWLGLAIVAGILLPIVGWLILDAVAIVDAYKVGKKLAAGQPVRKMEWFPNL